MDPEFQAIVQTFIEESGEGFDLMEESLVALEASPGDTELLGGLFRVAHTLKGNSASLGFTWLAEFAHVLEGLLENVRDGAVPLAPRLTGLLLESVDALRLAVQDATSGTQEARPEARALLNRLAGKGRASKAPALAAVPGRTPSPAATTARTLRVDIDKLDRLLNLTSEIAVSRGRVQQRLEEHGDLDLLAVHVETDRLYKELQERVMTVRMVPVGPTFRQFARVVRDIATAHGKQARLATSGEDVEVDTAIIEHIRDPLVHMLRNSLDHGIESPDVRQSQGKDPCGVVSLRAFHEAGGIVVEVADDGAGLSRKRIEERARSRGMEAPESLAEQDLHRLIFDAGFSTADAVTDLSGRGIGMDVVRRNIDALGGSVDIESREGQGTTFRIRMPLTLAIIDGFRVRAAGETYVVPVGVVTECLDLQGEGSRGERTEVIGLRGEPLPCLRLRRVFGLGDDAPARESVLVVEVGNRRAGLVVDELLGESQTVIKPLGSLFRGLPGLAGSTILGNGDVAFILDVPSLVRHVVPSTSFQTH
jgi:two-component system chemotaxis sensor kinase CheA